jgi:small-conductance mechanosensitive channel
MIMGILFFLLFVAFIVVVVLVLIKMYLNKEIRRTFNDDIETLAKEIKKRTET